MKLKRVLGVSDAGWLVAGSMIGSGIFIFPGVVAAELPGVGWPLLAWAAGGLLALCGAAVYGELGARVPESGGDYEFLTRAFGPFWGFLNGWSAITLTFSAAAAVQTQSSLNYLRTALPVLNQMPDWLAACAPGAIVLAFSWANTLGAKNAGRATLVLTALPMVGLCALFGYGWFAGNLEPLSEATTQAVKNLPAAFALALIPIYFAYSGWNAAAYLAGELATPQRTLGRGLLIGTLAVTLLYLAITAISLVAGPHEQLAGSYEGGALAARRLVGPQSERLLAAIIALAILGSANVTLMAGARVYYAMALRGMLPAPLKRVSRKGVPTTALWIGGVWAALLSVVGKIEDLLNWATMAILLLSSLAVASLFVFRLRPQLAPLQPGAFKCPGYPFVPALYLTVSLAVAVAVTLNDFLSALWGLLLIAAGAPLYLIWRRLAPE